MRLRILVALLLASVAIRAQQSPGEGCSIHVKVIDGITGEPLPAAMLFLFKYPDVNVRPVSGGMSESDGKFVMRDIAPGRYVISGNRPGFASAHYQSRVLDPGSLLTIEPGAKTKEIVVPMLPLAAISGRIEDENGKPQPGARVYAYRVSYSRSGRQLSQAGEGKADAEGRYRISDLITGKYFIAAAASGPVMTYYPGSVVPETAAPVEVVPGAIFPNIDVKLASPRTVCARIQVEGRMQASEVTVSWRKALAGSFRYPASWLAKEEKWQICGLIPGPYFAAATAFNGDSVREPIEVDESGKQEFRLKMLPQTEVAGKLIFEGKSLPQPSGTSVMLAASERGVTRQVLSTVDPDWSFTVKEVKPDSYLVMLRQVPDGFYVRTIRSGESEILGKPISVFGSSPEPIEIVLSPNVGGVSGTVQDAKGERAPGALVALLPEAPERQGMEMFLRSAVADEFGAFSIASAAPGRYRAMAFERVPDFALLDPEVVRPLLERGEPVDIREKSAATVRLKMMPSPD